MLPRKIAFCSAKKEDATQKAIFRSAFFINCIYFVTYSNILSLGSYSYYTCGAFDGDFFAG